MTEEAFGQWWAAHSTKARPERMFDAVKVVWQAAWRDATAAERDRCEKLCEAHDTKYTALKMATPFADVRSRDVISGHQSAAVILSAAIRES